MTEMTNPGEPPTQFRPRDVKLEASFPPLAGTFGRVEREAAATIMVRAMVRNGNVFAPIEIEKVSDTVRADIDEDVGPIAFLKNNPFWRPDAYDLVLLGFARWTGEPGKTIEFTDSGRERLRKYVGR